MLIGVDLTIDEASPDGVVESRLLAEDNAEVVVEASPAVRHLVGSAVGNGQYNAYGCA